MRPTAGIGFKAEHFDDAVSCSASGLWFEAHAESYMVDGGPRLGMLEALRNAHPLSIHGVGLSLAADADPDVRHMAQLKMLVDRFDPFVVSEHLAWSAWQGVHNPGLLPFPRTRAALGRIAANVMRVQDTLGRAILIENPALYMPLDGQELVETEFLDELVRRSGCSLLIDVNNVFISANNLGFSAAAYLKAIPTAVIGEIHLAGHATDARYGQRLLIDTHDAPICRAVWRLYEELIERVGPKPTLIERDDNIPPFAELLRERNRGHDLLMKASSDVARRPMSDLAAFQDRFSEALHHNHDFAGYGDVEALRIGLSVHRNTVYKALIGALRANYPTVERLVGEEWFSASVYAFLAENLPKEASLSAFGAAYPDFLATLPAIADLPYLPGVARLDRFWTEAHIAADADMLSSEALVGVSPDSLLDCKFRMHPGARLGWFAEPSPSIWRLNRPPAPKLERIDLEWVAEGALIARPRGEVVMLILDAASFAFLEKCVAGATLGHAAATALDIDSTTDLETSIAQLITSGAFMSIDLPASNQTGDDE